MHHGWWTLSVPTPERQGLHHAQSADLRDARYEPGPGHDAALLADDLSTWANENGYRPDAIERQLAHVESNKVRATYNKALLLDQRRTLSQDWADYLSAAEGSGTA